MHRSGPQRTPGNGYENPHLLALRQYPKTILPQDLVGSVTAAHLCKPENLPLLVFCQLSTRALNPEEFDLALVDTKFGKGLETTKSYKDGTVVCYVSSLWFEELSLLRSFLSRPGHGMLLDRYSAAKQQSTRKWYLAAIKHGLGVLVVSGL